MRHLGHILESLEWDATLHHCDCRNIHQMLCQIRSVGLWSNAVYTPDLLM